MSRSLRSGAVEEITHELAGVAEIPRYSVSWTKARTGEEEGQHEYVVYIVWCLGAMEGIGLL